MCDYATFVGCYKPTKATRIMYGLQGTPIEDKKNNGKAVEEEYITYKFVAQAFTRAYVKAWKKYVSGDGVLFLVIEEINRGNCAQIFGDLFQLLDRDENGFSKYSVDADSDLAQYLRDEFTLLDASKFPSEEIFNGTKLMLPGNMCIWATMNTSDQSLFPMDSAFKRRWDWKYKPVGNVDLGWEIVVVGDGEAEKYSWSKFLEKINAVILKETKSEDKQLGHFFVKARENCVSLDVFTNKVLFYLFNDVFKDYDLPGAFSRSEGSEKFAFKDFFKNDGSPDGAVVRDFLCRVMQ